MSERRSGRRGALRDRRFGKSGALRAGMVAAFLGGALFLAAVTNSPVRALPPMSSLATVQSAPAGPSAGAAGPGIADDIRDIRGPKFIAKWWVVPALVAGAVLLVLVAHAIWRRQRRRRRVPLPYEVALQRLEEIRALMEPMHAREFCIAISGIVRTYIEQGFDVIVTQRTTEEFLQELLHSSSAALVRHRALLAEFLQQCDFVKFAGMSLTPQRMESLFQSAGAFIRETALPAAVPESRPAPPSSGSQEAHDSLPST